MKYIVISDVHSNLEAFSAVVDSFPERSGSRIISAGDVVGYGADPDECIALARSLGAANIMGNHDAAVIDRTDISFFNRYARAAVLWTKENTGEAGLEYLRGLPLVREEDLFTVAHGTLHCPEGFIYMMGAAEALHTFEVLTKQICFVGHSHVPGVFILREGRLFQSFKRKIKIEKDASYIINAGSVGQPRDNDNRACYCVYDTDKGEVEFRRIEYDIKTAHDKIIRAGLPEMLAERLWHGR